MVFNTENGLLDPQNPELENHGCENAKLPANPELVQDLLLQLDPCK